MKKETSEELEGRPEAGGAPLSRRERKKAEVRRRLYETAMEMFEGQGFAGTTIEQITERVDVSPATFFNYFPSKEAVLGDYHRAQHELLLEQAQILEREVDGVRERFLKLSGWYEDRAESEGRIFRVLIQEFLSRPTILAGNVEVSMSVFKVLHGWIERGKETGEFRADLDSMLAVATILNIWNATMLEWVAAESLAEEVSAARKKAYCANLRDRVDLLFEGFG